MRWKNLLLIGLINIYFYFSLTANISAVYKSTDKPETTIVSNKFVTSTSSKKNAPQFVPNEFLIKFKQTVPHLISKTKDKTDIMPYSDIDNSSIPEVLKKINNKYGIDNIEKVIKNAKDPLEEIYNIKQRLSKEMPNGIVKINEKELNSIDLSRIYKIKINKDALQEEIISQYKNDPDIENIEPNYIYHLQTTLNDPYFLDHYPTTIGNRDSVWNPPYDYLWNLKKINLEQGWNYINPSNTILVAVVDSGVDYTHPEFGGCNLDTVRNNQCTRIAPGYNYFLNSDDPMDTLGHGTHVSGIIASITNNSQGIAGIGMNTIRIIPLKIADDSGNILGSVLASALYDSVSRGARVVNMSWGGAGDSSILSDVFTYLYSQNITLVAAAGNDSSEVFSFWPANVSCQTVNDPNRDCVITVSSTDENDKPSSFTNWGGGIDVSAPGGNDLGNVISLKSNTMQYPNSLVIANQYLRLSGTSMAAPHVSALAGLIVAKNIALTSDEVRNIILNGSDDLGSASYDGYYGYGRINVYKTLSAMNTNPLPPVAYISFPSPNIILGRKFEIKGSSYGQNFSHYILEYQKPSSISWFKEGIHLNNSGTIPVRQGILSTVNLNNLENGVYNFRLTSFNNTGGSTSNTVSFKGDTSVRDGFPIFFGSDHFEQSPVISDINNDGKNEIIFNNRYENKLYVVNSDGLTLPGWPQITGEVGTYDAHLPIVIDLDRKYPGKEIILSIYTGQGVAPIAYHSDGTLVTGWSISDWNSRGLLTNPQYSLTGGIYHSQPFLFYAEYFSSPPKANLFDSQADELPGWPVILPSCNDSWLNSVISDLNNDDKPEIIIPCGGKIIYLYSIEGNLIKQINIPVDEELKQIIFNGSYLYSADIDGDKFKEIMAVTVKRDSRGYPISHKIYAWNYNGDIKSSLWPYTFPNLTSSDYIKLSALGDTNQDGKIEMFIEKGHYGRSAGDYIKDQIYIVNYSASIIGQFQPNIAVGFATSNNVKLITNQHLMTVNGYYNDYDVTLNAFTFSDLHANTITLLPGFPKQFPRGFFANTTISDLNNDNQLELVVPVGLNLTQIGFGYSDFRKDFYLYVFNTNTSSNFDDWPQYLHDERHTGTYESSTTIFIKTGWNKFTWPEISEASLSGNCPFYTNKSNVWNGYAINFNSPKPLTTSLNSYFLCR